MLNAGRALNVLMCTTFFATMKKINVNVVTRMLGVIKMKIAGNVTINYHMYGTNLQKRAVCVFKTFLKKEIFHQVIVS